MTQQINQDLHINGVGIRVFSMFTGVGGFELGLGERFRPVGFSEIDRYASELLADKFPGVTNYGDATNIDPAVLPDFDMLCGGFPCQTFSVAGRRAGFEDTRGTLFFDVARIIKDKKPRIVFLENVKGLLNHDGGTTFRIIIQTLGELGYDVQWMVLNSKFHGVPQNRERVFIIGSVRGSGGQQILPFQDPSRETYEDNKGSTIVAMRGRDPENPSDRQPGNPRVQRLEENTGGTSNALSTIQKDNLVMTQVHNMQPRSPDRPSQDKTSPNYSSGGSGHLQRDDIGYCVDTANSNAVEFNNKQIRKLTPIECERLQGFPDNWTSKFSDTQRYKMMGNAVTVNVIRAIGGKLQ